LRLLAANARYSASLVWAMMSSSALMRANRPALKLPSCVSDRRFHRNFSSHLSISWNSMMPRLALLSLPVEPVGAGIGLRAVLGDGGKVDAARQVRDVLRLWIGRAEGADAHAVILRNEHALHGHVFDVAAVFRLHHQLAGRTKVALDAHAQLPFHFRPELVGDEMERFLVHRTSLDGVHRSLRRAGELLQPPLEHGDNGRFPAADRSHEEQDALADVQPFRRGMEIFLDELFDGPVQPENFLFKKFVALAPIHFLHAVGHDHLVDAGVRRHRRRRVLAKKLDVVPERARPGQFRAFGPVFRNPAENVHGASPPFAGHITILCPMTSDISGAGVRLTRKTSGP